MGDQSENIMERLYELNSKIREDPQRPAYHFLPLANWMNDPNGPIYYKRKYHLFYQFNPYDDTWGDIHWGHAKSNDLISWEHLPIALKPSKDLNETHCFSGVCIINDGKPTIIYTSIGPDKLPKDGAEQWMAIGDDNMIEWIKSEKNPIMNLDIHEKIKVEDWRDPFLWKEKDFWYMILGGHLVNPKRPAVFLYKSKNLYDWVFVNPLIIETRKLGKNWECPNFFQLKNKYVLIVSPHKRVIYSIGTYKKYKFSPEKWNILDYGKCFYATNVLNDKKNERVIIWGWIRGGGDIPGWNGCLSLPRVVSLNKSVELNINPIPELGKLRNTNFQIEDKLISKNQQVFLEKKYEPRIEIKVELKQIDSKKFGFKLNNEEKLEINYSLGFDTSKKEFWVGKEKAKLNLFKDSNILKLHIFIDHSIFEVYINDHYCITSQIKLKNEIGFSPLFFTEFGKIKIKRMDIWTLKSIW